MTPREEILKAARILLEAGVGLIGHPGSKEEIYLLTPEAVVAYDRANMAKCDLDEILRRDEQEAENILKKSPATAG